MGAAIDFVAKSCFIAKSYFIAKSCYNNFLISELEERICSYFARCSTYIGRVILILVNSSATFTVL